MSWFQETGDKVRAALVSILRDGDRLAAGAGVLLSPRRLITCAHVVNDALGSRAFSSAHPGGRVLTVAIPGAPAGRGTEDGPAAPAEHYSARTALWVPPRRVDGQAGEVPEGALEWWGDLAVLELAQPSPSWTAPLAWSRMSEGQSLRAWHGSGHPRTFVDVLVKTCDDVMAYVDGGLSGAAIGRGYSGGPLWSSGEQAVVGLVAAGVRPSAGAFSPQQVVRRSWCIPWQAIRAEFRRAGVDDPWEDQDGPKAPADGNADPVRHMYTQLLGALLAEPAIRADHARRLAEQCGLSCGSEGSTPTLDELAAVLVTRPRALATLTESLVPQLRTRQARAVLDDLLLVGRTSGTARLLSHGEHRRVLALLAPPADQDPGLLPRAAADALKYHHLPAPLRAGSIPGNAMDEAVSALEALNDSAPVPQGTPRVPALLRLVEYVAVCVPGPGREALHSWNAEVAERLGIHDSALHERRADAVAWAGAHRTAATRVVVSVTRWAAEDQDRYACAVWRSRPDGSVARTSPGEDLPRTPEEVAQIVRDAVHSVNPADDDSVPMVEVVVDREGLHLPVDEWNGMFPYEVMPRRLGEDFHVVLRCPELRRRSRTGETDLERRWRARGTADPLVADERMGKEKLRQLLVKDRHCSQVVLRGARDRLSDMLLYSLAMGVPIVLWDRAAEGEPGDAAWLAAVDPHGALEELPERVRCFRSDAYADPGHLPARPALVWENADHRLPGELWLADPCGQRTEAG